MKNEVIAACGAAFAAVAFATPVVSNVSVSQAEDRRVTIGYTVSEPAIVTIDILTNGVSIGGANLSHFQGAAFKRVPSGDNVCSWAPQRAFPGYEFKKETCPVTAVVTAWATNAPPDYMVVDLEVLGAKNFYTRVEEIPGGVTNKLYKTTKFVMRKILAMNVTWREGSLESELGRSDREAARRVTLTKDFYIGIYEYTFAQERLARGVEWTDLGDKADKPMEGLYAYHNWRNNGETGYDWPTNGHEVHPSSLVGRFRTKCQLPTLDLPTEAQWEFACRAGTGSALYTGESLLSEWKSDARVAALAWYKGNAGGASHPVGLKKPNAWGLYDMLGNVLEVMLDKMEPTWSTEDQTDPTGPKDYVDGNYRVLRGGSYDSHPKYCRSADRAHWCDGTKAYHGTGARFVCDAVIP